MVEFEISKNHVKKHLKTSKWLFTWFNLFSLLGRTEHSGGSVDITVDFEPGDYLIVATFQVDNYTGRVGVAQIKVDVWALESNIPILKIQ